MNESKLAFRETFAFLYSNYFYSFQGEMTTSNPSEPPIIEDGNSIAFGLELPGTTGEFSRTQVESARILIFDNNESSSLIRPAMYEAGFKSISFTNQFPVVYAAVNQSEIDLLMLDEGFLESFEGQELVRSCKSRNVSVLVLISDQSNTSIKTIASELKVDDFLKKPVDSFEVITRSRNILNAKLASRQLAEFSAQVQSDILIDQLTGISNRRAFDFELSRKMIEWQRQRSPLALLMIDIDYFKQINDKYGHQAGDLVLVQVAARIKDSVRDMDLVCRYGGEEFAAILPIKRPQESIQTAERIRQRIENTLFEFDEVQIPITVSIGVAEAMNGDDQELIVKRADTALYDSKRNGRNRVAFHDGARCLEIQRKDEAPERARDNGIVSWAITDDVFNLCSSNILVVDDSWSTTQVVKTHLVKAGFKNLVTETDSRRVMNYFTKHPPELVLLDIDMPFIDGLTILKEIRAESRLDKVPVIIFTSHTDNETKSKSLDLGASDFLQKPIIASELVARVTNNLLANAHTRFLANYSKKLEQEVKIRTVELIASRREAIQCLARAAEMKDDKSGRHVIRVGKYAAILANELGFSDSQVIELEHAAQLHDVGKLGLPDSILEKREVLTDEEFSIIKDHCNHGGKIIRDDVDSDQNHEKPDLSLLDSCSTPVMRMAALVAESHHEKWDGTGYPNGLREQNIPIEGRIVAICDVFDAISNPKAYREAFDLETCFEMIREGAGSHFDPEIVDAFFRCRHEIIKVYRDFAVLTDQELIGNNA